MSTSYKNFKKNSHEQKEKKKIKKRNLRILNKIKNLLC